MIDFDLHTIQVVTVALLTGATIGVSFYALLEIFDPEPRISRDPPPELKPDIRSVK